MKLIRFEDASGHIRMGEQVDAGRARLLRGGTGPQTQNNAFGDPTPVTRQLTEELVEVRRVLAPVEPPNIIAIGLNYRQHAIETGAAIPAEPIIFAKLTTSVIGPGQPIVLPASAPDEVDYESELAVVIGRSARRVPEREALRYVLGYTCANDVSARDCQKRRDRQWARAKSFDTFCPLGPCLLVDADLDPNALRIRGLLNGEVLQDSNTSDMIFSVQQLVSYLSHQFTLLPGTVILTGTPPGVGVARTPPRFLRPGDTFTVSIDGIGELSNPVSASG